MHPLFTESAKSLAKDFAARRARVKRNLNLLKDQDSIYADAHWRLDSLFDELLEVVERHQKYSTGEPTAKMVCPSCARDGATVCSCEKLAPARAPSPDDLYEEVYGEKIDEEAAAQMKATKAAEFWRNR